AGSRYGCEAPQASGSTLPRARGKCNKVRSGLAFGQRACRPAHLPVTVRWRMIYWLHVAGTFLMRFVPVGVAYRLAAWGTPLALSIFARGYLRRATDNMHQVLGPQAAPGEARRLTRAAFANYARYMVDLVRLPHLKSRELVDSIRIE